MEQLKVKKIEPGKQLEFPSLPELEEAYQQDLVNSVENLRKTEEILWNVKVELDKYFKKRKEYK